MLKFSEHLTVPRHILQHICETAPLWNLSFLLTLLTSEDITAALHIHNRHSFYAHWEPASVRQAVKHWGNRMEQGRQGPCCHGANSLVRRISCTEPPRKMNWRHYTTQYSLSPFNPRPIQGVWIPNPPEPDYRKGPTCLSTGKIMSIVKKYWDLQHNT